MVTCVRKTSAPFRYYRFSVSTFVPMVALGSKNLKYLVLVLILLCALEAESKRGGGSRRTNTGGRRTTPRSHYTTPRSHHTTPRSEGHHDIGFENVQHRVPQQNSPPIGFNTNQHAGGGHQPQQGDTFHKTNVNQVGSSNSASPSAPLAPPPNNQGIGFENIQKNPQPIGFNVPQNAGGGYHPQSGAPSAPIGAPNSPNYHPQNNQPGFNVPPNAGGGYNPQQNNQPGFNVPPNTAGGYHPQQGFPQQNNQPGFNVPPNTGSGYHPQLNNQPGFNGPPNAGGGYHPQQGFPQQGYHPQAGAPNSYMPHNAGGYPGNYYQSPGGGVYNPQPYYNPHYNGAPPQIYQPVQQSSGIGGSLLGYAGTFAGGYLIGKLTSGGSDSGDRKYEVHHYHHNRDGVPKQITVSNNSLATCSQNDTQGLCVPNTFPICLSDGTIMCVTHTPYTVPCGTNSTMACVISILPCPDGNSTCNSTGNLTETAVYIPCISNVTVAKRKVLDNTTSSMPSNVTSDSVLNNAKVELCVTAIAEPKVLESPVGSYMNLLAQMAFLPFTMNETDASATNMPWNTSISSSTGSSPVTTSTPFTVYSSTGNSLFNVSSSIETTTINFLNETNLPGTVQPLSN